MINQAKWIWISDHPESEEYGEFHLPYCYHGGKITLQIAAESDYIAELNGKTVRSVCDVSGGRLHWSVKDGSLLLDTDLDDYKLIVIETT